MFRLSRLACASVQAASEVDEHADQRDDQHQPAAHDGRVEQPANAS